MGYNKFDLTPQVLVIGGAGTTANGTGSFTPHTISRTGHVSFGLTKLSDKNSIDGVTLATTNKSLDWTGHPGIHYPSGSLQELYWFTEPDFTTGATTSLAASSCAATGSAVGSVTFEVQGLNAGFARITVLSKSGGTFEMNALGKEG